MTPLLFLDFDGVINTPGHLPPARLNWRTGPTLEDGHLWLQRELVERLSALVDEVGCQVVFHTSWIYGFSTGELVTVLQNAGFSASASFCSTPIHGSREDRIMQWRRDHFAERRPFAVLDDCWSTDEFPTAALGRLVFVEPGDGLTEADVTKAGRLMRGWSL